MHLFFVKEIFLLLLLNNSLLPCRTLVFFWEPFVIQFELRRGKFVYSFCSAESHLTAGCVRYGEMLRNTTSFQMKLITNWRCFVHFLALGETCCRRDGVVVFDWHMSFLIQNKAFNLRFFFFVVRFSASDRRNEIQINVLLSRQNITKYKTSILPF